MKVQPTTSSALIQRFTLLAALCFISGSVLRAADTPPKPQPPEPESQRLVSLVLLLSEPRTMDAGAVAHAVSKAEGSEVPEGAVVAQPPSFIVKAGPGRFAIHSVGEPYFAESDKLAAELKDPTLAKAIRQHRAWLSVDWIEKDEKADLRKVYQQIGLILAQLVRKDTLAVYSPDTDQFHLSDATLLGHLKSEDPLQDLYPAGVAAAEDGKVTISSDDPQLIAAQTEADERWPEFLRAFKERGKDQYFAVKGRILEGDKGEYLWLQVSDIDDKLVHGKLDNDPATLKKIARGADLHIPIDEVDDWLYSTGSGKDASSGKEEVKGGFTLRLFDQLAKAKRPQ